MIGVPLSYAVHAQLHPLEGQYDPPVDHPNSDYQSYDKETLRHLTPDKLTGTFMH